MSDDSWEERMSARAHARAAAAKRLPDGRPYEPCMTGDGNLCVPPVGLCQVCLDRPYGTVGDVSPPDVCRRCWSDRLVWHGNCWSPKHIGDHTCRCDCHRDEVVFGSASIGAGGEPRTGHNYGDYFSGPTRTSVVFPAVEAEICDGLSVRGSVEVPLEQGDRVVYLAPDGTTYGVHHRGAGSTP